MYGFKSNTRFYTERIPVSIAWSDREYISSSSLDGILVHRKDIPLRTKLPGTHLHNWMKKRTVKVKCLAQENHTAPRLVLQRALR